MKVLIISPKFHPIIGGGETYILNTADRLQQAGISVEVAAEPHNERKIKDYNFRVHEINGLNDNNANLLESVSGLHQLLDQLKPDIIHVHGYVPLMLVALAKPSGIPLIASVHSTPVWGERIIGAMDSFDTELTFARNVVSFARPRLLTAANKVYADAAERIAKKHSEVIVMPYPIDINHFSERDGTGMRNSLGVGPKDVLILTPSRIIERKGIKEAVFALNYLPENYYLCLPCAVEPLDQPFWDAITSDERYRNVQNRVLIPSKRVLYEDMPLLYAASDVVAMPSYYEGAPVATVEAMAAGKPFVGANSQGINSFIRSGENGLLVPKQNIIRLADAIRSLASNENLKQRLSKQARKDIAHLSWDVQLPRLLNAYKNMLEHQDVVNELAVLVN